MVTEWYPSDADPSHGIFVRRQAAAFARQYPQSEIVLIHPRSSKQYTDVDIKENTEEGYTTLRAHYPRRRTLLGKFFCYRAAMKKAVEIAEERLGQIDLVWCQVAWRSAIVGHAVGDRLEVPFVITEHWTGYSDFDGRFGRYPFMLRSWISRLFARADAVVAVSESQLSDLEKHFKLSETQVIGNVIEPMDCTQAKFGHPTFIHISTLSYQKNIPLLLDSFIKTLEHIPDAHLHIAGGSQKNADRLREEIKSLEMTEAITVHGQLSPSELESLLCRSHVLVHTSRFESFSMVVAESWAAGIPAVATRCGGLTDDIPTDAGASVAEHTAKAVSQAMMRTVERYSDFDSYKIKKYAEPYLPATIAEQYYQLFSRLTD